MVALYKDVAAYKCWPAKGGFDCLQAVDLHGPDEIHFETAVAFTRGTVAKLPAEPFGQLVPGSSAHYTCSIQDGMMQEQIISNDHTLIESSSSFPPTYSAPWSASFVENFYSSNRLQGMESYLNCPALGAVFSQGSLETLRTNLIDHTLLTPTDDALSDAADAMATSAP
jgi:hypothetical protein